MGAFEDFLVKTKTALGVMGGKAGQFIDISKIRIDIAEAESSQRKEFEKLGRLVYHFRKSGNENEDAIADEVAKIETFNEKIEELRSEIDERKNKVVCKSCKNKNDKDSFFCAKCGDRIDDSGEEGKRSNGDSGDSNDHNESSDSSEGSSFGTESSGFKSDS
ncbi:MAG: hypothetical protein LBP36_03175 [Oscillospiraceae bacterium]|jgi:hypothetical protein|nr:hypothetical protein [Oscillospiraceae bacterium]